jgi:PBP1b-binding outer membrane lipoprotein LpoB
MKLRKFFFAGIIILLLAGCINKGKSTDEMKTTPTDTLNPSDNAEYLLGPPPIDDTIITNTPQKNSDKE